MVQRSPATDNAAGTRLVKLLDSAGSPGNQVPLPCFGERLSTLFGLGDTMRLDAATAFRYRQQSLDQGPAIERLVEELARTRRALRRSISNYGDDIEVADRTQFEPCLNAWLLIRRKLAANSHQMRDKVRKAMKEHNQNLARLAELDSVFDHTMASYSSQCFSHIPRVLEQRFQALQTPTEHAKKADMQPEDWFQRYCEEAQALLLAELDVRLEPVLGLLEACHNEVNNTP